MRKKMKENRKENIFNKILCQNAFHLLPTFLDKPSLNHMYLYFVEVFTFLVYVDEKIYSVVLSTLKTLRCYHLSHVIIYKFL